MSRSGYTDEYDERLGLWRGAVESAIRGRRGQRALSEMASALDEMPVKELGVKRLVSPSGEHCALGVLGKKRGIDLTSLDSYDYCAVARAFDIAPALAREITYENDERFALDIEFRVVEICGPMRFPETHIRSVRSDPYAPEAAHERWVHMRQWVRDNLIEEESK